MELKKKLNEKNKNIDALKKDIKDLENKNIEIMIKKNEYYEEKKKEIDELKEIINMNKKYKN